MATGRTGRRKAFIVVTATVAASLAAIVAAATDLALALITADSLTRAAFAGARAATRLTTVEPATARRDVARMAADGHLAEPAVSYRIDLLEPAADTKLVRVSATGTAPSVLARLVGRPRVNVSAVATAKRLPLDASLVLDVSYSLERTGAFDDLKRAAIGFVGSFDEDTDQVGLISYSTVAAERVPARKHFARRLTAAIDALEPVSDTNVAAGLDLARAQLQRAPHRSEAVKVAVLFTDGRPTAFSDRFRMPDGATPAWFNGVVAAYVNGSSYRGLFRMDDGRKVIRFLRNGRSDVTDNVAADPSPKPKYLPGRHAVNGPNIRELAAGQAQRRAAQLREAGYAVYAVGLANPQALLEEENPDLVFLRRLANEGGVVDPTQPAGRVGYASSVEELDEAFRVVADDIVSLITR